MLWFDAETTAPWSLLGEAKNLPAPKKFTRYHTRGETASSPSGLSREPHRDACRTQAFSFLSSISRTEKPVLFSAAFAAGGLFLVPPARGVSVPEAPFF